MEPRRVRGARYELARSCQAYRGADRGAAPALDAGARGLQRPLASHRSSGHKPSTGAAADPALDGCGRRGRGETCGAPRRRLVLASGTDRRGARGAGAISRVRAGCRSRSCPGGCRRPCRRDRRARGVGAKSRDLPRHGDVTPRVPDGRLKASRSRRPHRRHAPLPGDRAGVRLGKPAAYPRIGADDAVEEHDEAALGRRHAAREVDTYDARAAESDGAATVGAYDDTPEEAARSEHGQTSGAEPLRRIALDVHEIPPVGPTPVQPEVTCNLEPDLATRVFPVDADAPNARVGDEDPGLVATRDGALEEDDPAAVDDR